MLKFIANQFRKPEGFFGRIIARLMESGNRRTNNWIISLMNIRDKDTLFEVGFGPGYAISRIAHKYRHVRISGIDYSGLMYEKASLRNYVFIQTGRVNLSCGDLMDFKGKETFSKIYGINVVYFWNDLDKYLAKLLKLLKKKGELFLYMSDPSQLDKIPFARNEVFNKYTRDQLLVELKKAGFRNITFEKEKTKVGKAYCFIAVK
jgi:trans-aconitate methyltransferase